jgi:CBS domain-containing protein
MTISDVIWAPAVSIASHEPLWRVVETMSRCGYGFLPITESRRVVGVITGRDIAIRASAKGLDGDRVQVSALMSSPAVTVPATSSIEDTLIAMRRSDLRRLVVVDDDGVLVGVVGLSDLVGSASAESLAKNLQRHAENCPRAAEPISMIPGLFLG